MTKGNRKAKKLARQRKAKTGEAYTTSLMKNQGQVEAPFKFGIRPLHRELGTGKGAPQLSDHVLEMLAMYGVDANLERAADDKTVYDLTDAEIMQLAEAGFPLPFVNEQGQEKTTVEPNPFEIKPGWSDFLEATTLPYIGNSKGGNLAFNRGNTRLTDYLRIMGDLHIDENRIISGAGKSALPNIGIREMIVKAERGEVTESPIDADPSMFERFLDPNEPHIPDLDWTDRGEYMAQRAAYFRYQQLNNGRECTENQLNSSDAGTAPTIFGIGGGGKFRGFRIFSDRVPTLKDIDWNILRHIGSQEELEAWVDERIAGGGMASLKFQNPIGLEPVVYDLDNVAHCHVIRLSFGVDLEIRHYAEDQLAFWWEDNRSRFPGKFIESQTVQKTVHEEVNLWDTAQNMLRLDVALSVFESEGK